MIESYRAFVWRDGRMKDLGTLPGDTFSQALFINASGQIVGQSSNDDGSDIFRACLWENGGPPIDLNVFVPPGSDLHLHEPFFITDSGEIVGKALLSNGDEHVFVLTPKDDGLDDVVSGAAEATRSNAAPAAPTARRHAARCPVSRDEGRDARAARSPVSWLRVSPAKTHALKNASGAEPRRAELRPGSSAGIIAPTASRPPRSSSI